MRNLTVVEETANSTGLIGLLVLITVGVCLICVFNILNLIAKQHSLEALLKKVEAITNQRAKENGIFSARRCQEETFHAENSLDRSREKKGYWNLHDLQTDLYNKQAFESNIAEIPVPNLGILFFGIIGMRRIDDIYGRGAGDQIVKEIAKMLNSAFQDECYRMDSDVFCVMTNGYGENILNKKKEEVQQRIEQMHFRVGKGKEISCEIAVGMCCGAQGKTKAMVISEAEKEMLSHRGRNGIYIDPGRTM